MTSSYSQNGYLPDQQDYQDEIRQVVQWELNELNAGRSGNALLLDALVSGWSVDRLRATAQQRGRSYRFLSALTDRAMQAHGVGLIAGVAAMVGADLSVALMHTAFDAINRLDAGYRDSVCRNGYDPVKAQIHEFARQSVFNLYTQSLTLYQQQMARLILNSLRK